jgi:hypothetical protein
MEKKPKTHCAHIVLYLGSASALFMIAADKGQSCLPVFTLGLIKNLSNTPEILRYNYYNYNTHIYTLMQT